jgi:hypothetical protein
MPPVKGARNCKSRNNDKIYTPIQVAKMMIDMCVINENDNVDVIIGNPPYSLWDKWIDKTIKLKPKKICYIFGYLNFTPYRLKKLYDAGYHINNLILCKIDWYMSQSFLVSFTLNKCDYIKFDVEYKTIMCPKCGKSNCRRTRNTENTCILDLDSR